MAKQPISERKPIDPVERAKLTPWEMYIPPFKLAPGVYDVGGNNWMTSYLIDTGDGLVLIDGEIHECVHLIFENIRSLGYDPHNITDIFTTHAHLDHIGGISPIKAFTGAKVWMGERDLHFLNDEDLVSGLMGLGCAYTPFEPDCFYDYSKPVNIGKISFETVNTAGHTPGTTSFFFDVADKNGKKLRCGLHGGLGVNTLVDEYFNRTGEDRSLRDEYLAGLKKCKNMHVDVCLPSHINQTNAIDLIDKVTDDFNPFDDPSIWDNLIASAIKRVEDPVFMENQNKFWAQQIKLHQGEV